MTAENTDKNTAHVSLVENGSARENRNHKGGGIKFFEGTALPEPQLRYEAYRLVSPEQLREDCQVWRPEETLEAAEILFTKSRVNVVGGPQSGKGTILFGLSDICDIYGWGYVFIDGHYQDTDTDTVVAAIAHAEERNVPIFFDSFDYLFAGSRKVRSIRKDLQRERTQAIVEALGGATVPIATTSHNEQWAERFIDLDLKSLFTEQLARYPDYAIPVTFRSRESVVKFLSDHGIPSRFISFITEMDGDDRVLNTLIHRYGDWAVIERVLRAVQTYPVLKELVRGNDLPRELDRGRREEFWPLVSDALSAVSDENYTQTVSEIAHIILEAEVKGDFLTFLR